MIVSSFTGLVAAVIVGNLFTAMFFYGAYNIAKYDKEIDAPWKYWLCMAVPFFLALGVMISFEGLPPSLDALTALM